MAELKKAFVFARDKHKGQLDDDGEDYYIKHLLPVATAVSCLTTDTDVIIAALLHDTIEDTKTSYGELVENFGKRVADLVMEVSHEGKADNYGFYFPRLQSAEAIIIKLCDRASNISRMNPWEKQRKAHYLSKTQFWKDGSDL